MREQQNGTTAATPDDQYRTATGVIFGRIRRTHGWSLRDFGERVGVSHTSLYAVERGEAAPTIDTLARVAAVEGLDLPAMLALVIDELLLLDNSDTSSVSLPALIAAASPLDDAQRAELLRFIDFLKFRVREAE